MGKKILAGLVGALSRVIAVVYRIILYGVTLLYRKRIFKTHRLPVPVVSVGNLTWGGTGKTPLVMHLAKNLQGNGRSVAVLTRGYGRDEADLMRKRLEPIPVLVGSDRVRSARRAVEEKGANLLLLDDGYQQWRVRKDLEILMVNAADPFVENHLIPWGTLREPAQAAERADLIVITRADRNINGREALRAQLQKINPGAAIFFAHYRAAGLSRWPHSFLPEWSPKLQPAKRLKGERICSLAGIAHPEEFEAMLKDLGAVIALKYRVRDHHPYTTGEMIRLLSRCQRHGIRTIVTTAKDAVRIPKLLSEAIGPDLKGMELWVLEVDLEFEPDEAEFLHRVDSLLAGPELK